MSTVRHFLQSFAVLNANIFLVLLWRCCFLRLNGVDNNKTAQYNDVETAAEYGCVQDDGDIADDEKLFEDPLNTQKKPEKKDTATGATHSSRSTAQEEVSRDDICSSRIDERVKARPIVIEPSFAESNPSNVVIPITIVKI